MNFKHLQTFVTICECGTVSRAAAQLRITQPALSRRIEALQNELGLRLFDNRGRRLLLTSEGKEFLRHSRALLAQAETVLATGRALGDGRAGVLRIGGAPHTLAAFFPSFVTEYEKQNSDVRIRLFEAGAAKLLTMIEHGELHFAVTLALGHDHLAKVLLPAVQLLALTAPRSRYGGDGRIEIGSLRDVPLLVMPPGYATRETFDAACRIAGVHGSVVFESATLSTLAAFAEAAWGCRRAGDIQEKRRARADWRIGIAPQASHHAARRSLGQQQTASALRRRFSRGVFGARKSPHARWPPQPRQVASAVSDLHPHRPAPCRKLQ